jgi:hypothetical protein
MVKSIQMLTVYLGVFSFVVLACIVRHFLKNTCTIRHRQKRYVAMDYRGRNNAQGVYVQSCNCWGVPDCHRFSMRWFCDICGAMGEHCWDKTGEWKLEMGKIVPDEKRWAQRR